MCRVACRRPQMTANEPGAALLLHRILGTRPRSGSVQRASDAAPEAQLASHAQLASAQPKLRKLQKPVDCPLM